MFYPSSTYLGGLIIFKVILTVLGFAHLLSPKRSEMGFVILKIQQVFV